MVAFSLCSQMFNSPFCKGGLTAKQKKGKSLTKGEGTTSKSSSSKASKRSLDFFLCISA